MTERNFKVIRGGINATVENKNRSFVSAFVTDTRLMGVVVLYIHWELEETDYVSDFHQFFYYDAEEFGLESYKSLMGDDSTSLSVIEQALLGGLGGSKVDVTEREALFLLSHFIDTNKKLSLELPEEKNEYIFLIEDASQNPLTPQEEKVAFAKMCTPIVSEYQLINYFLMRSYSKDADGLMTLVAEDNQIDDISEPTPATLCKNTIDEFRDENGFSYLCESLIECDKRYLLVVTEISTANNKIKSAKRISAFIVSPAEAAMMLNRPEFITVYEVLEDLDNFDMQFNMHAPASLQTIHDNGKLSMQFNKNNNHVNKKVFRLNDDIHGLFFITDLGQFVVAAYSLYAIHELESDLRKNSLDQYLLPTAKYEFKEPILYEFIQSDYDDFTDFLDSLSDEYDE